MDKIDIVDLTNPQWKERNIREYTVNCVADLFKKQPQIHEHLEYHCFLMNLCEKYLHMELQESPTGKCWNRILSSQELSAANLLNSTLRVETLLQLSQRINNDPYHLYPLLDVYRAYNKLSEADAVRSLCYEFGILREPWFSDYQNFDVKIRRDGAKTCQGYSEWSSAPAPLAGQFFIERSV